MKAFPTIRNYRFSNVRVKDCPVLVDGMSVHPNKPLDGFALINVTGIARKGISLANVKNAEIRDVKVTGFNGPLIGFITSAAWVSRAPRKSMARKCPRRLPRPQSRIAFARDGRRPPVTIETVHCKTFYIETFGCQMNAHDSEKVIGTLLAQGYSQVDEPEDADLVLYNTCSIRDKAEQKVFNRLQQFKRDAGKGKVFGVLGLRGAAGRREDLRARAACQPGLRVGQLYALRRDAGAAGSRQPPRDRPEPGHR